MAASFLRTWCSRVSACLQTQSQFTLKLHPAWRWGHGTLAQPLLTQCARSPGRCRAAARKVASQSLAAGMPRIGNLAGVLPDTCPCAATCDWTETRLGLCASPGDEEWCADGPCYRGARLGQPPPRRRPKTTHPRWRCLAALGVQAGRRSRPSTWAQTRALLVRVRVWSAPPRPRVTCDIRVCVCVCVCVFV